MRKYAPVLGTWIKNFQYCLVSYRGSLERVYPEGGNPPLLLAVYSEIGKLDLYRNILAESRVEDEDKRYIEVLLKDLKSRAVSDPQNLFRHLNELNSGPLVTQAIHIAGDQTLSEIFCKLDAEFLPL